MVEIIDLVPCVYVILGIDDDANDRIIAVCRSVDEAKRYCMQWLMESEYVEIWWERHQLV